MRRIAFALLYLALTIGGVFSQTIEMPAPQAAPPTQYVTGWDDSGFIASQQVGFTDLSFVGLFGASAASTTANDVTYGNLTFILDNGQGFAANYTVQIRSNQDAINFMYGIITAIDTSSGATVITVAITQAQGGGNYSDWALQVVAGPTFGLQATSASGIIASSFSVPAIGDTVSQTTDTGKAYLPGASVYVQAIADYTAYFMANVVSYNSSTGAIVLFVQQAGGSGAFTPWTISMVDTAGATVTTVSYSSTPLQFGASHDIFVGATVPVTTGTNKLFNPGSHIILNSTTDSTQYFRGISQAYNSGTGALSLFVTDVGPTATGTIASWSLFAQDGPSVAPLLQTTSATSVNLSTVTAGGTVTFVIPTPAGITSLISLYSDFLAYSASDPTQTLVGEYVSTTGGVTNLNLTVIATTGTSTKADWVIQNLTGPFGRPNAGVNTSYFHQINYTNSSGNLLTGLSGTNSGTFLFAPTSGALTVAWPSTVTLTVAADTTLNGTPPTITGSPASGNLTKFSAATSITNGDLSGDVTTSGTLATTIAAGVVTGSKIASSVALAGSPTTTTQSANDNSTKIATTAYVDKCHATVASGSLPAAANQDVAIPAGCGNIMVTLTGAKCNATCAVEIQFSTNSGGSYDTTVANYDGLQFTGAAISTTTLASILEQTTATSAQTMSGSAIVFGYGLAGYKNYQSKTLVNGNTRGSQGAYLSTSAITNVRIVASSGSFTAGSYVVSTNYLFLPLAAMFGIGRKRRPANDNRDNEVLAA